MSIDRILSWFPSAWRSRYEAEVRDLLEAQPFTWRQRCDLVRACADAWLREGASWIMALPRWAGFVRTASVLTIGWFGVLGTDALAPLAEQAIGTPSTFLATAARFGQFGLMLAAMVFVLRPYAQDSSRRPSRFQATLYLTAYAATTILAHRSGGLLHQAVEVLWFGLIATMRYPWFQMSYLWGQVRQTRSVLGLR